MMTGVSVRVVLVCMRSRLIGCGGGRGSFY